MSTMIGSPQFQIRIQWKEETGQYSWEIYTEQKPGRFIHTLYKGDEHTYIGATIQAIAAVHELTRIEEGVEKLVEQARIKAAENGHTIPFNS